MRERREICVSACYSLGWGKGHRRREVLLLFVGDLFAQPGAALARKPSATPTNAKQALCLSVRGWVSLPQVSTRHWLVWKPSTDMCKTWDTNFVKDEHQVSHLVGPCPPSKELKYLAGYQTLKTSVADSLRSKMLGVLSALKSTHLLPSPLLGFQNQCQKSTDFPWEIISGAMDSPWIFGDATTLVPFEARCLH